MRGDDPSGLALAERAHAAGAVQPAPAALPQRARVQIEVLVDGTYEHAQAVAGSLAYRLSLRPDVRGIDWTVSEPR